MTCNDEDRYEYVSSDVDLDENLKMEQWCEVDIDSNGNKEVLIELSNGNILVLHSDDDRIYSYVFPFRGMKEIKLDGSFESSGSAANTYIGKVKFVNGECFYDEICAIDETDEKKPIYRIDKKDTNREKVESYLNQQKEKEAVLWITDMIEE